MSESRQQRFLTAPGEIIHDISQQFLPIGCPEKSSNIWEEVHKKTLELYRSLLQDFEERGLEVENIEKNIPGIDSYSKRDLYEHVAYILKIVDKVLESIGAEDQINTIFFIDKSGRIVAHLFKAMWNDLRKNGLIEKSITCPRIKFLNDGNDYSGQCNATARGEAAGYIKRVADKKGILVVDEVITSGRTVDSVLRVFQQAEVNTLGAMSAYPFTPLWYSAKEGQKGVQGVSISNATFEAFDKLPPEDFLFLRKIIYFLIESGVFSEVMTLLIQVHPDRVEQINNLLSQKSVSLSAEEIRRVAKIISNVKFQIMDMAPVGRMESIAYAVNQFFLYFKYHAGFLVQPLKLAKERRTGYLYRRVLREMIRESTKYFYLAKEKESQDSQSNEASALDGERDMMIWTGGKLKKLLRRIERIFG